MFASIGQPFITTGGMKESYASIAGKAKLEGGDIGDIEKLLNYIEEKQQEFIDAHYKNGEESDLLRKAAVAKMSYICTLLAESYVLRAQGGTYSSFSYAIDSQTKDVDLSTGLISKPALGMFIEKELVFKAAPGASAGQNFAGGDISAIDTELKTSLVEHVNKAKQVSTQGIPEKIKSGDISLAVMGESNQEKEAYKYLMDSARINLIASFQLYIKMRNLLYMQSRLTNKGNTSLSFAAITFFIEIIMKKIKDWVNTQETARGHINVSGQDIEIPKSEGAFQPVAMMELVKDKLQNVTPGFSKLVSGGKTTYRVTYRINLGGLLGAGWGNPKIYDFNQMLKNLTDLYLLRKDILPMITGEGKGGAAAQFFGVMKSERLRGFTIANIIAGQAPEGANISYL
jgi:hypothetical protein